MKNDVLKCCAAPPLPPSMLKAFFDKYGLSFVMVASYFGSGSIFIAADAGVRYGYTLIWAVVGAVLLGGALLVQFATGQERAMRIVVGEGDPNIQARQIGLGLLLLFALALALVLLLGHGLRVHRFTDQ